MTRARRKTESTRGIWIGIGCATAFAAAWVSLAAVPYSSTVRDLLTVVPAQAAPVPGAALYSQYCAACHQANGQGMPGTFPSLVDDPIVKGDPRYLARVVLYGLKGRIVVNGRSYNSAMAGFAGKMDDSEIADLLTYIRSSWGNTAPEVNGDVVKAERAVPGTPQDNGAKYPQ